MKALRSTPARIGVFVAAVAVLGGGAFAVGSALDPVVADSSDDTTTAGESADEPAGHGGEGGHGGDAAADEPADAAHVPGGLQVSDSGYTLHPVAAPAVPAAEAPLQFHILGPDGQPVTDYEISHDKELHLIVVRRDLTGFQHVHPTMAADGTWTIPFTFPAAGTYRMYADFMVAGAEEGLTLGADLQVAGAFVPAPLPAPMAVAEVDGYEVRLDGELVPGTSSRLTLTVTKDGVPVTNLEPYLGAYGHLVALRDRDLAYLHVHPDGTPGDASTAAGPEIVFYAEVPTTGDYRLFLDFSHGGTVHTAEFTATAADAGADGHGGGH